jgi:hypothetical protein
VSRSPRDDLIAAQLTSFGRLFTSIDSTPHCSLTDQLNTSSNTQSQSVSQANASIIHSLQSELATVKSSFAIKVSNVEERYNEVIVKTKEEVQSLEKALEERGQEVNLLRSQVRMDEGD